MESADLVHQVGGQGHQAHPRKDQEERPAGRADQGDGIGGEADAGGPHGDGSGPADRVAQAAPGEGGGGGQGAGRDAGV